MRNCKTALPSSASGRWAEPACFQLLCFLLWLSSNSALGGLAQEPPDQTSSQQAIGFTADFMSTVIFKDKDQTVMSGKIYASPPRVRFEPQPEEADGSYHEIHLYDFEQQKMRRVFLDDKIYFEVELTENSRLKAMRDGWIPWKDLQNTQRRKIRLKEDFVNDHPCVLYLQERRIEIPTGKKSSSIFLEYSLAWEATHLKGLPVRIIYFIPDRSTVVVDYKNVRLADPDPPLFRPPEGFRNLSPF